MGRARDKTLKLFDSLSKRLDEMNENQEKRHEEICSRFEAIEHNTSQLAKDFQSLKERFNVLEDGLAAVKVEVEKKADESTVVELDKKIYDLQNRSQQNNVVFWNVLEGSENGTCMIDFVQGLLAAAHVIGRSGVD